MLVFEWKELAWILSELHKSIFPPKSERPEWWYHAISGHCSLDWWSTYHSLSEGWRSDHLYWSFSWNRWYKNSSHWHELEAKETRKTLKPEWCAKPPQTIARGHPDSNTRCRGWNFLKESFKPNVKISGWWYTPPAWGHCEVCIRRTPLHLDVWRQADAVLRQVIINLILTTEDRHLWSELYGFSCSKARPLFFLFSTLLPPYLAASGNEFSSSLHL